MVPFAVTCAGKNIDLQLRVQPETPEFAIGDPARLQQVIANLVGNAMKFTTRGEIVVTTSLRAETESDYEIIFTVSDSGIGMSQDDMDKIFEPFVQADGSTTRKFGGTGLGLAIVKSFVEMMGGAITVESEKGKGTVFTVTAVLGKDPQRSAQAGISLPSAAPTPKVPITLQAPLNRKFKVLIAEDNEINAKLLRKALELQGIDCDLAVNGQEAVTAWARQDYDLIFMDCQMPVMDGYEATRQIRLMEEGKKRTPIIALTAHSMSGDADKCFAAGMDVCVFKPYEISRIMLVLEKYLILG